MKENELALVLEKAIQAYRICNFRNHPKTRPKGNLAKMYPDYFRKTPNDKYVWCGTSADDVIEEYLSQFGYPRGSLLWHQLCEIVIKKANRLIQQDSRP